jgi:NDP-sugar pyrophosphorylase family protein
VDLAGLLARHEQSGAAATIAVSDETTVSENNSTGGQAASGTEATTGDSEQPQRPASNTERMARQGHLMSPVGVYVFEPEALEKIGAVGYQDIKEVLIPRLHADGEKITLYGANGPCPRVSGLGSYLAVNEWVLEHFDEQPEAAPAYRRAGEAWVHSSAEVDATAQLIGAVLVGPGSQIGKGAMVVGPCVIGAECVIASEAIVCRSVLWDLCRVGRGASVDRCVLAHYCSVPGRSRLYDRVQLSAPEPGRLLRRLQVWTGARTIPRSLPMRRVPARTYDPASAEAANQGKPTGASKKRSVGVSAI